MLVFDPSRRISVDDALRHPYLAALHDAADEPVADAPFTFEVPKVSAAAQLPLSSTPWEKRARTRLCAHATAHKCLARFANRSLCCVSVCACVDVYICVHVCERTHTRSHSTQTHTRTPTRARAQDMTTEVGRELMWEQVLCRHPELARGGAAPGSPSLRRDQRAGAGRP
jgi:hypothetical protein